MLSGLVGQMRWNPHISRVGQRWNGVRKSAGSPTPTYAVDHSLADDDIGDRRPAWNGQRTQLTLLESPNRRQRRLAS